MYFYIFLFYNHWLLDNLNDSNIIYWWYADDFFDSVIFSLFFWSRARYACSQLIVLLKQLPELFGSGAPVDFYFAACLLRDIVIKKMIFLKKERSLLAIAD